MKKSVFWVLHAIVASLFLFVIIGAAIGLADHYKLSFWYCLLDSFLCYGSFAGLAYVSYFWFVPKYLVQKKFWHFLLSLIVVVGGFSFLFTLFSGLANRILEAHFHYFVEVDKVGILVYSIVLVVLGTSLRLFIEWIKDAQAKLELEKDNFQSELTLLKNQLNPHFLFNTLNNIDSLIIDKSPNASPALNKLSEIMRYVVYDSAKDFVPLSDEILYLKNYIALQKLRVSNEDIIKMHIAGNFENGQIAPMLFIPFVENAFKHASLKDDANNNVEISIQVNDGSLCFSCVNHYNAINKDSSSGVGLDIVKKRLEMIYKNNYTLTIQNADSRFVVNLEVKL